MGGAVSHSTGSINSACSSLSLICLIETSLQSLGVMIGTGLDGSIITSGLHKSAIIYIRD